MMEKTDETIPSREELAVFIEEAAVSVTNNYEEAPAVLMVDDAVIGTLGNFSASIGKAKSKKTFNVSAIAASALSGRTVLRYRSMSPENKRKILYIDTEQGRHHCQQVLKRILRLAEMPDDKVPENLIMLSLRKFAPRVRLLIVEEAIGTTPDLGLVIIDGIRDFLYDINSSSESTEVISKFMQWTDDKQIHIHTVLHQNKNDEHARGHIGTELNNKANTYVMQGNYDTFEARLNGENEAEAARNETLRKEIKQLEAAARKTAEWSNRAEENKRHADKSFYGKVDRGFLGAASERMMKRSKASLVRQERAIEEKQTLLKNVEQVGTLRMTTLPHPKDVLISVENGAVRYGNRTVCENVRFTLRQGERLALIGANGCGKSSILKGILGESDALTGSIRIASGVTFSSVRQRVDDLRGSLRDFIRDAQVDETLFKAILRNMDCPRELFDHDLQEMSQGQRKKILLARSLCEPAHVFVWDEPLNYIDVFSRVQLETLIRQYQPTMLLVEHDRVFVERVATGVVEV